MAELQEMPEVRIPPDLLAAWGSAWLGTANGQPSSGAAQKRPRRFDKRQGMEFGHLFDSAFGAALATMLGGIPVVKPNPNALIPPQPDCVEVGTTR